MRSSPLEPNKHKHIDIYMHRLGIGTLNLTVSIALAPRGVPTPIGMND